jgi:hypothetical protein
MAALDIASATRAVLLCNPEFDAFRGGRVCVDCS